MVRLTVVLTTRGGRDAITGRNTTAEGVIVVRARVAAPPVDGRANAALDGLLAAALNVPPSTVRVVAEQISRRKQVEVEGLNSEVLIARLEGGR